MTPGVKQQQPRNSSKTFNGQHFNGDKNEK